MMIVPGHRDCVWGTPKDSITSYFLWGRPVSPEKNSLISYLGDITLAIDIQRVFLKERAASC